MHPIVYLPCELTARDLEPRMLLANEIASRGPLVVVGQLWAIYWNMETAPPGILIASTVNAIQAGFLAAGRKGGHKVIGVDQENLPFAGDGWFVNIAPESIELCDRFLVPSEAHREAFAKQYPACPVDLVGDPRIDLLRTAAFPRPMQERYILFNTGFGIINSVWPTAEQAKEILMAGGGITEEEHEHRRQFETAAYRELTWLLKWCGQHLAQTSVVRPHPSENAGTWNAFASPKCRIVAGAPPLPWIAHADIVVHANSTTGLEAALLDTPAINVVPEAFRSWADRFVMTQANVTVPSGRQAADLMQGPRERLAAQKLPHFPRDATRRIADVVAEMLRAGGPLTEVKLKWRQFTRTEAQRQKFSATRERFRELAQHPVVDLDDSLILMGKGAG